MTKRITSGPGREHYKVRVVILGAILHLASTTKPTLEYHGGRLTNVTADWLSDPNTADTLGWIDWPAVAAITWRWTGETSHTPR